MVQVNGRVRAKLRVAAGLSEAEIVPKALAEPAVAAHIDWEEGGEVDRGAGQAGKSGGGSVSGKPRTMKEGLATYAQWAPSLEKRAGWKRSQMFP